MNCVADISNFWENLNLWIGLANLYLPYSHIILDWLKHYNNWRFVDVDRLGALFSNFQPLESSLFNVSSGSGEKKKCAQIVPVKFKYFQTVPNETKN